MSFPFAFAKVSTKFLACKTILEGNPSNSTTPTFPKEIFAARFALNPFT